MRLPPLPHSLLLLTLTLPTFVTTLPHSKAYEISQPAGGWTIHVAPDGNDGWSVALARPSTDRNDGPVATLAGARDRLRALRRERKIPDGPITVLIANGTYPVSGPVVFEPADGGTAAAPVTYRAAPGARPIFDGGRAITGFSRRADGLWTTRVPDIAGNRLHFEQLFVNGRRATRRARPTRSTTTC